MNQAGRPRQEQKPDNLVILMQQPLNDEQKLYIDGHRKRMKRTELAKKTGISKLQLNHYLGGGDSAS